MLFLFVDVMILYIGESKYSINRVSELTKRFGKVVGCKKINAQKYTENSTPKQEPVRSVPFIITVKNY